MKQYAVNECDYEISRAEALARLAIGEFLKCCYEFVPNDGLTRWDNIPRSTVVQWIEVAAHVYESGPNSQSRDFGIYIPAIMLYPEGARHSLLFLPTRPECRLTPQQLEDTVKRGRGTDIFSQQTKN